MEEHKKPGRTLQDYAHLFLSRNIEKEKQSDAPAATSAAEEEIKKTSELILSNETAAQNGVDVSSQHPTVSLPQDKTAAGVPVQMGVGDLKKRPYAIAVSCPGKSLDNSFLTFNLCLDFISRGLQVLVLNADLSFPGLNFLASLKLHGMKAAAQQQEVPSGRPLPEIQLITVDTDITVLTCPWPDEQNPIIDEITGCAHKADVILINTAPGFSSNAKALFKAADEIILISKFEPAHLIDTYSIVKVIHQIAREAHIDIIITGKKEEAEQGFKKLQEAAQEFLGRSLYWYGFILRDEEVINSIIRKAPLPPDSAGGRAVHDIAEIVLSTKAQWQRALNPQEPGFTEKLFITTRQEMARNDSQKTLPLTSMTPSDTSKMVTFERIELAEKKLLASHLQRNPGMLGKEFNFLRTGELPDSEFLLGMDGEKRLQIVEIAQHFDEGLLYRSLSHLQWTLKNSFIWGKDAEAFIFDRVLTPGIIYVVPDYPVMFLEALELIDETNPLTIIKYIYLEAESIQGFYLEPLVIKKTRKRQSENILTDAQIDSLREQAGLTREEIMKFLT